MTAEEIGRAEASATRRTLQHKLFEQIIESNEPSLAATKIQEQFEELNQAWIALVKAKDSR
jgi:hypothetical protein